MTVTKINGTRMFHTAMGEGPPVVLIPGLGATHASFQGVAPLLVDAGLTVVMLDLRGVGQSDRGEPPYSMEGWAEDVLALMDHLGLADAHIVGSSLGGCVALALADKAPRRVKSLVLAATFSETDRLLELNYRVRIALVEQAGLGPLFADYAVALLFGRSFLATERGRAVASFAGQALRQNDSATYIAHLEALLRFGRCEPDQASEPKFTARLDRITAPALVLCGDEDVLTVPKFSRILADRLVDAELAILPGCGHANFAEQPEASARLMLDFFHRIAAPAATVP